ncbi:unnamed protein product [Mytilus coruscus]|uniref:ZP domain-containing protein n=1 Tax=Mytilus coruscus TaxID=42192 RepID=A0A6J7ZYW4_MYTCO|nr:unnamed protein product [Mytilus coruscus]
MRFKEGESLNKPDLSEVYIGDRFYMYLKYMGETDDYIIVPQTCTAYKGTFRTNIGEKLELWKQSTTNGGDCRTTDAKQYKVMENFKRLSKTIVHAELHGFRFSSELTGEFDDVTISCTVKVCTSEGGKCEDNCKINGNRRRRGIDKTADNMYKAKRSTGRIRSQTVFQTIKVGKRGFKSNNGGKNGVHGGTVAILVVAGIVFWKAFH